MNKSKRKSIGDINPLDHMFGLGTETDNGQSQPNEQPTVEEPSPKKKNKKGQNSPTLFLINEKHIIWLDKQCNYARQDGGIALNRAMIIRTLLDICVESRVDLHTLKTEEELKVRILEALK